MKREKVLSHLHDSNCKFLREGGNHTMYINNINGKISPIPRHTDIRKRTVKEICKQLGIEEPSGGW